MKLDIDSIEKAEAKIQNINFHRLIEVVDILSNGNARMKPNVLPSQGGVYAFWWTGEYSKFTDINNNFTIPFKGPNQRDVIVQYNNDWINYHEQDRPIPLYVGKTADNISKRIGLHLQLGTSRTLINGTECLKCARQTTSNQMRDRIDRVLINEKDTSSLILYNVGLSFHIMHGDNEAVNRFFVEDRLIGKLLPLFNLDIER